MFKEVFSHGRELDHRDAFPSERPRRHSGTRFESQRAGDLRHHMQRQKQNPNAEDGAAKKGIHTCNVCIGEGKNVPIILVRTPFPKIEQQGTNDVVSVSAFWYIDSHPQVGNCTLGVESIKVDGVVTVEIPFIKNTKAIKKGDRLILVAP